MEIAVEVGDLHGRKAAILAVPAIGGEAATLPAHVGRIGKDEFFEGIPWVFDAHGQGTQIGAEGAGDTDGAASFVQEQFGEASEIRREDHASVVPEGPLGTHVTRDGEYSDAGVGAGDKFKTADAIEVSNVEAQVIEDIQEGEDGEVGGEGGGDVHDRAEQAVDRGVLGAAAGKYDYNGNIDKFAQVMEIRHWRL
ncbi:MAG: hypothetical protein N2595_02845 [bacterium]|nr:hypothetical protein [bacterium]